MVASISPYRESDFVVQFFEYLSKKNKKAVYATNYEISKNVHLDIAKIDSKNKLILFYHLGILDQHLNRKTWREDLLYVFNQMINIQKKVQIPGIFLTNRIKDRKKYDFIREKSTELGVGWDIFEPPDQCETVVEPLKTSIYQGVFLCEAEAMILEELEQLIEKSILPKDEDELTSTSFSVKEFHVVSLALIYEGLSKLPDFIGQLIHLQTLNLVGNQLADLPHSLVNLPNLTRLILQRNQFVDLPKWLRGKTSLKVLDLGDNPLENLPEWIGDLTNLERLGIQDNHFTGLPDSFRNLTKLHTLRMARNQFMSLPEWFRNLRNLKVLDLSDNQFESLPEWFGDLNRLESLSLMNNQFVRLPDSFGRLTNLRRLYLDNNRLRKLNEDVWRIIFHADEIATLENNNWDPTAFSKMFRRIPEEDKDFNTFLYNLSRIVFQDDLKALEFESKQPIPELDYEAIKNTHRFWLSIGTTLSRVIYSSLLGTALLKYSTKLLETSINVDIFVTILIVFVSGLFLIIYKTGDSESTVRILKDNFIDICYKSRKTHQDFVKDLSYYLQFEYQLASEKWNMLVSFCINIIVSSLLTGYFTLVTTPNLSLHEIPTLLTFQDSTQTQFSKIICITVGLLVISFIIAVVLKKHTLPTLHLKFKTSLSNTADEYEKHLKKQEKIRMELETELESEKPVRLLRSQK
ncbi:MAG: leucine-rich repeat domain-containing protein [Promethearchaeota archaeon]